MAHVAAHRSIVGDSLAMAVVMSSDAPTLLLDGNLDVVAGSASFSRAFQIASETLTGKSVFALGAGEWDVPQLRSLLRLAVMGDAGVDAYEMDLRRSGLPTRRLVITARVLDYADPTSVRVLMAATDVTEARLAAKMKDDLLRETAVLHQELQHRVANSLQIIASVLMQSAKRATLPEDAKGFLVDAHSRVMSVAALQRQFAESFMKTLKTEEVDGSAYRDLEDARARIGEFIDRVYNRQRLHSALHYLSPEEFEAKQTRLSTDLHTLSTARRLRSAQAAATTTVAL